MSVLYGLATAAGFAISIWFAYVLARFVTGYPRRYVDEWEHENVGER